MLLDVSTNNSIPSKSLSGTYNGTDNVTSTSTKQGEHVVPTLMGDIAAIMAAASWCIYLLIGQRLRSWIPLWMYAFPVNISALVTTIMFAACDTQNPITWKGRGKSNSIFGFVNLKYLWFALYLGVGPGICGHTILNALLKHLSPLTISTATLSEPIIGSLIGHLCGMQPIPGPWTFMGGFVLLLGLVLVNLGENGVGIARMEWKRWKCRFCFAHKKDDEAVSLVDMTQKLGNEMNKESETLAGVDILSQYGSTN